MTDEMSIEVTADPQGRKNHWLVNGGLLAGPKTQQAAAITFAEYLNGSNQEQIQITGDDVRAEAQRRLMALVAARDTAHLEILISNGSRAAIRLLRKGKANWTAHEATRAARLEMLDREIEAIRNASNALEAMDQVPEDYADDKYWP